MRRVALLVGNSQFEESSGISNLQFPGADVKALSELLSNELIGRFDRVISLVERSKDDILSSLAALLDEERGATVFFYYSGHGKVSDSGRLYLAASNTTERHLSANGVPFAHIIDMKDDFGCGRFCTVLDCCYAGLASSAMKGSRDDQLKAFADGSGVFFLGAANATAAAREDPMLGHGVLTAAIIDGLKTGKADVNNAGRITGPDLFAWCRDFAAAHASVGPVQINRVKDDELVIAFSPRRVLPEALSRVRVKLNMCFENRLLDHSELDQLQSYFFGQQNVMPPQANTLAADFLAYADSTIRFDELLQRRSVQTASTAEHERTLPREGPSKSEETENRSDDQETTIGSKAASSTLPPQSPEDGMANPMAFAMAILSAFLGALPICITLSQSYARLPSNVFVALVLQAIICTAASILATRIRRRVGPHLAAASYILIVLPGSGFTYSINDGGVFIFDYYSVFFLHFVIIPVSVTYVGLLLMRTTDHKRER